MDVNKEDILKLREMTGCGFSDCKKALVDSGCDFDKAVGILRNKGLKVAYKRSSNKTNEGVVMACVSEDRKFGVIVCLSCETDFVSRTDSYCDFVSKLVSVACSNRIESVDSLNNFRIDGCSVRDKVTELVAKFCENIKIDYKCMSGSSLYCYNHFSRKVSSLVDVSSVVGCDCINEVGKVIAVQVAAFGPMFVDRDSIDRAVLEEEKSKLVDDDVLKSDERVREVILKGRLDKFLQEKVLLEQKLYLDSSKTVKDYLNENKVVVNSFETIKL